MKSKYIKSHLARTDLSFGSLKTPATGQDEAMQSMPLIFRAACLYNSAKDKDQYCTCWLFYIF